MRTYSFLTIALMVIVLGFTGTASAQDSTKVEVYKKIHIPKKSPIPYASVGEADVLWEKTVWRMIDLREKSNLPLYYPLVPIGDRVNLITLILVKGLDENALTVYNPDGTDEFKVPMAKEEIEKRMGNVPGQKIVPGSAGQDSTVDVKGTREYTEIKKFLVKEKWFFDKKYSRMQVRILGLCPIRVFYQAAKGVTATTLTKKQICWVYYPEFRNLFASNPIYNRFNDAQQTSFDDFFMQRRFSSFIYQESNVYNNRVLEDYTMGLETLMEGERIKESITNWEQDIWEL